MKICVVTSTRADFGLLSGLMHRLEDSEDMVLQVVVTGSHLLQDFGDTLREVEDAGFVVSWKVHAISHALTGADMSKQVGMGVVGFTEGFLALSPDVVVILGDRYEMLSAAIASFFLGVPILHIHGGEVTEGALDDGIRHSISKFSRVHAVAAQDYADRLIRAGESPEFVHVVGGLGVDEIQRVELLTKANLEAELGISLSGIAFLVTYHPVTAGAHHSLEEISHLTRALDSFPEATVVFTMPNADPEHQVIWDEIRKAVDAHGESWKFFASLGQQKYLSLAAAVSAVVGNSSSGLTEVPSLKTPTVNIGPRQKGRLQAVSVINCSPVKEEIRDALHRAISPTFEKKVRRTENPYGEAGATEKIVKMLRKINFKNLGPKVYYDLPSIQGSQMS